MQVERNMKKDRRIAIKIIKLLTPNCGRNRLSAGTTVEAALVIPLYVYAVMAVMYVMQIVSVKNDISVAAYNSIRTMSKYYYGYEAFTDAHNPIPVTTAYVCMMSELGVDYGKDNNIIGGSAGIILLGSEMPDEDGTISITIRYSIKNPFDVFGIGIVTVNQTCKSQAWLGENRISTDILNNKREQEVYITEYGNVYHLTADCTYIDLSVKKVDRSSLTAMRNKAGKKYSVCEICGKKQTNGDVYITDYGDRYHTDENCRGLSRNVIKVPLSYVKNMRVCSKCKEEQH